MFIVLGAVGWACGFSIFRLVAYLKTELLLVLGTSSSESALPRLIEKMEAAGCPKAIVGLVVPTGYSFNLDGTNIYMTLAALFIAQALNVHLSLGEQLLLLGVAMLSSKGAAGVTGAGFITLAATLQVVPSVPVAGMALILGVDRFMSECRSLTNFIGNAVADDRRVEVGGAAGPRGARCGVAGAGGGGGRGGRGGGGGLSGSARPAQDAFVVNRHPGAGRDPFGGTSETKPTACSADGSDGNIRQMRAGLRRDDFNQLRRFRQNSSRSSRF